MWPKALMQLLELAPHITRLVPAADRYLQSRSDGRESQRVAIEQMAEGLRGDLKLMAAAQAGIDEMLTQQSGTLAGVVTDVRAARVSSDAIEARLQGLEARMARLWTLILAGMILLAILAVCTIAVLLHMEHSIHGS
jgi:hypothetical protein